MGTVRPLSGRFNYAASTFKRTECTEFLLSYCDYLEAVMRGDLDDFNRLASLLRSLPKCFANDVLNVVKPATKKDLAALPIDRAASRSMH